MKGDAMFDNLRHGITCLDAGYVEEGSACFYLLESNAEFAVVETGTSHSLSNLTRFMADNAIAAGQIRYIIPTHVHLDHAGGVGAMMAAFPEAELLVHPRGARHMADPEKLVNASRAVYGDALFEKLYGEIIPVDAGRIREMADGSSVELAGRALVFRHTEGHARHHFCIWDEASRGWFAGDMFGISYPWCRFAEGDFIFPSTTPTQFDPAAYLSSLDLLHSYAPQRMYLTHYGMLEYSEARRNLLAGQVERYEQLVRECDQDGSNLEAALVEHTVQLLGAFSPGSDVEQLRGKLGFDMELNAQGLQHWFAQQSG